MAEPGPIELLIKQEEEEVSDLGRQTILEHTFDQGDKTYRGIIVDVYTVTRFNMLFEQIPVPSVDNEGDKKGDE